MENPEKDEQANQAKLDASGAGIPDRVASATPPDEFERVMVVARKVMKRRRNALRELAG